MIGQGEDKPESSEDASAEYRSPEEQEFAKQLHDAFARADAFWKGRKLPKDGVLVGKIPKKAGRHRAEETPWKITVAAALEFLGGYSDSKMAHFLYQGRYDNLEPEMGRQAVWKFCKDNRAAIDRAKREMTLEQAKRIKQSLPSDKIPL